MLALAAVTIEFAFYTLQCLVYCFMIFLCFTQYDYGLHVKWNTGYMLKCVVDILFSHVSSEVHSR